MILYNKIQTKCIEHPPAPLMIIAGAGTGKTTTIVGRIAHFIEKRNINPKSILALTYTVKAAEHLKKEISEIVGNKHDYINAMNFHSFALEQTMEYFSYLGYKSAPSLVEANESKYIIRQLIMDNVSIFESKEYRKNDELAFNSVPRIFDQLNDDLIYGSDLKDKLDLLILDKDRDEEKQQLIDSINILFKYQKIKKTYNLIDFGDMLINLWKLLNDKQIHREITKSINHVVVDEFQDNNFALTEIVKKISTSNSSVTIVGDDDQSIYSFRGANNNGFNNFRKFYQKSDNYAEIILNLNYRSTQSILNFANESVKNIDGRLKTEPLQSNKNDDSPVILYEGDRVQQKQKILDEINEYLQSGEDPSELCILTRSRSNSIEISNFLNEHSIKNSYYSGKFFEDQEVKDFISFVNILSDGPYQLMGLYRLMLRLNNIEVLQIKGAANKMLSYIQSDNLSDEYSEIKDNKLIRWIKSNKNSIEPNKLTFSFLSFYKEFYKQKVNSETISQLNEIISRYVASYNAMFDSSVCLYLNNLFDLNETFFTDAPSNNESIQIMTIHQSKGMEFNHVMIPFLSSGTFPASNKKSPSLDSIPIEWKQTDGSLIEDDNYNEEKRIFHVAITRSKKKLILFSPEKRKSKFFKEIDSSFYQEMKIIENNVLSKKSEQKEFIFNYRDLNKHSFSATSLSLYESCPLSYKYRMLDRLKVDGYSPDAALGIFVHDILEKIYSEKDDSKEFISDSVDSVWDDSYFKNSVQSDVYRQEAFDMIFDYITQNPINLDVEYLLEKEFAISLESADYRGKLDRVDIHDDGTIEIIDYKTSKKKKTSNALLKDIQLSYYAYLLSKSEEGLLSKIPDFSRLEYIRFSDEPSVRVQFDEDKIAELEDRIKNISKRVQENIFTPKKNSICFYCEYKRLLCPLYK